MSANEPDDFLVPSEQETDSGASLSKIARGIRDRYTLIGRHSRAWGERIECMRQPQMLFQPNLTSSHALEFTSRVASPHVARDFRAWQQSESNLHEIESASPPPKIDFEESSPPLSPMQRNQSGGIDTVKSNESTTQRFHRSLRNAIAAQPQSTTPSDRVPEEMQWELLDRSGSHPISHAVQERLADSSIGSAVSEIAATTEVFDDGIADSIARRHNADAVTNGDRIAFRLSSYRPDTKVGLALLGHELTHVTHRGRATTSDALRLEEHAAIANERDILGEAPRVFPTHGVSPTSSNIVVGRPSATALSEVRTAAEDRPLDMPHSTAPAMLTESQVRDLKQQIYRDIVNRIRVEFERAGS